MADQHPALQKVIFVFQEVWDFLKNLTRDFMDNNCQKSAAALTYLTLFALVPTMTVTYAMFSLFPIFDGVAAQLQDLIFSNLLPETSSDVQGYLSDFSSQARNLTSFGAAMLVITAYLMLTNIEKTFNAIWGVQQARRGLSSFLLYWAVLSIGPLLLGAGLLMSTYLLSLKVMVQEYDQLGLAPTLFSFAPVLMTASAFTLLFAAVPNCRVPIKFAASGGLVTAICFELLKLGFGAFIANSTFKLIYGAFAVVPVFLLWINMLWIVVLAGAVFVRTLSEQGYNRRNGRFSDIRAVLQCLAVFREKSQSGSPVYDRDCTQTGLGLVHWQHLRSTLVKNNWIAVTDSGGYVLSRDLKSVTLWDVACLVNMPINESLPDRERLQLDEQSKSWLEDYFTRRQRVEEYAKDNFELSLDELFAQS